MDMPQKTYPVIGCCGLDCGLCPRFYTIGRSRCPGCAGPDFFNKHPSCSFITCCVKKRGLEICGQCPEFPCSKFKREAEYQQAEESSSYPSSKKILPNLSFIKTHGIEKFIQQQGKRIRCLETMINSFDDGRSRSFFCRAAVLLDPADLSRSLDKAARTIKTEQIKPEDRKQKARILKKILTEIALKKGVELGKKK